jgi:hypothetical protein
VKTKTIPSLQPLQPYSIYLYSPTASTDVDTTAVQDTMEVESARTVSKSQRRKIKETQMRTPSKKGIKKHTWRTPERHVMRRILRSYINSDLSKLPTPKECWEAIRVNIELRGLTIGQIKGWVFSERRRRRRQADDDF